MKKILNLLIIFIFVFSLSSVVNAQEEQMEEDLYFVGLSYGNETVSIDEVKIFSDILKQELASTVNSEVYKLILMSDEDKVLEETEVAFTIPEGLASDEKISSLFVIPYHIDAGSIRVINDEGDELSKMDIGSFCGDGECQKLENYHDCPEDCSKDGADDYCNKESMETDPDCSVMLEILDREKNEGANNGVADTKDVQKDSFKFTNTNSVLILSIIIIISIIFVISGVYFIRSSRN